MQKTDPGNRVRQPKHRKTEQAFRRNGPFRHSGTGNHPAEEKGTWPLCEPRTEGNRRTRKMKQDSEKRSRPRGRITMHRTDVRKVLEWTTTGTVRESE